MEYKHYNFTFGIYTPMSGNGQPPQLMSLYVSMR